MKSRVIILILILLYHTPLFGQIDFSRYMDENFTLPLLDIRDHLPVTIKWNMKGTVQADLNEGLNLLDEGYPQQAIASFDAVIKADSNFWVPYYFRGICQKQINNLKVSKEDFKRARKLNPSQAEICIEFGELCQISGNLRMAVELYKEAAELNPALVLSYYNLGGMALMSGETKKAFNYYAKCNEIDSHFPQSYMIQGIIRFKKKKNDITCITFFDQALRADSTYSQTYFWRGLAYMSLKQNDRCMDDWNKLVRYNPLNSFYILMRGFLHVELNQYDLAFSDLRKALRGKEVSEEKFEGQQTLLDKQIDLQNAANYLFSSGFGLKSEASFGFLKKGFCLLLAGKNKEAIESLQQAEKLETSAAVFYCLGVACEHAQAHMQAYLYYDKALLLDNDIYDAHKKRGIYRFELKQYKDAYKDFDEMIRLQPGTPMAYRLRGLVKSNEGDYAGAIDDLNHFMKSDSSDFEVLRTRSLCRSLLGDKRGSNDDLWRMWQLSPADGDAAEIARGYLALEDTAATINVWKKVGAISNSTRAYVELSRIYLGQQKWDSLKVYVGLALAYVNPSYGVKEYSDVVSWSGLLEYNKGSYKTAIEKFSHALEVNANNLFATYFRARSYLASGETSKALIDLKKISGYRDSESLVQKLQKK